MAQLPKSGHGQFPHHLRTRSSGFGVSGVYILLAVFSLEYLARLYSATRNKLYKTWWDFALSPAAMIDLLVIVSMTMTFLGPEASILRLFRALRILRLARLGRFSQAIDLMSRAFQLRYAEMAVSALMLVMVLVASSTALYVVEGGTQPQAFGSIPRAMWWSIATLTTVGYGDIVPVTGLGRVFAAVTALTGIAIVAVPTGLFAAAFAEVSSASPDQDGA